MSYATITDVSTRLGRPISDSLEVAQVTAWIGDIEALILARIPTLAGLITAGSLATETVTMVEANAVIRKIRNPDGKQNEKIDDYSYGLNANAARGELFLSDDEWDLLTPNASSGAFTVTPYGLPGYTAPGMYVSPLEWIAEP